MRLIFGWELDSAACPEMPEAGPCLGAAVVGPLGLIDVLERWLGLGCLQASAALRVAQQLARLQAVASDETFYTRSLQVDGWATARELLRWRDALVAGGWQGTWVQGGGSRLDAFAAVEAAGDPIAAGLADRVASLMQALESERERPPIGQLAVTTPPELLPPPWHRLLQRLAKLGTEVSMAVLSSRYGTEDLAAVQGQIGGRGRTRLAGDGSVFPDDFTIGEGWKGPIKQLGNAVPNPGRRDLRARNRAAHTRGTAATRRAKPTTTFGAA
jgi:ATP-dependent helicase/nuclease subunit B